MKVGDGLGSKGTISSVLGVRACIRVLGYPYLEKNLIF